MRKNRVEFVLGHILLTVGKITVKKQGGRERERDMTWKWEKMIVGERERERVHSLFILSHCL